MTAKITTPTREASPPSSIGRNDFCEPEPLRPDPFAPVKLEAQPDPSPSGLLEPFEALRVLKHGADYPLASGSTGDLLRTGRPEGLLVVQNIGSGLGDVVLADVVARAAGA